MLSKRLLAIAKTVKENEVVYDVGTDHGLLPCFLVKEGICNKTYASDIREKPLKKAKDNIAKYHLEGKVIPVLSDGVDVSYDDVTTLIFAGMGFYTVRGCLDRLDLSKYQKIIVQVNTDVRKLREYISNNEYMITDEITVHDDFFYQIVVFNAEKGRVLNETELEYGPLNLKKMSEDFIDYLKYEKEKYLKINQPKYEEKIKEIDFLLSYTINKECEDTL